MMHGQDFLKDLIQYIMVLWDPTAMVLGTQRTLDMNLRYACLHWEMLKHPILTWQ
jgi:hypothetical protein